MSSIFFPVFRLLLAAPMLIVLLASNTFAQTSMPSRGIHILSIPYYSIRGNWDSTLTINNGLQQPLTVPATLYALNGSVLRLPDFSIPANQTIAPRLSDLIAQAGGGESFREGSIELRYDGLSMRVGAQVTVFNSTHGLSFDMEPPMGVQSSTLEGLWWSADQDTKGRVMLSNTTDQTLNVRLNVEWQSTVRPTRLISLSARQTVVLDIKNLLDDLGIDAVGIGQGGLSISHNGSPGALIGHGVVLNPGRHFASNLPFIDPAAQPSAVLEATGLLLAHPVPGSTLPTTSFFTPILPLKNASSATQTATVTVQYKANGIFQIQTLPAITLAPHEVQLADFSALLYLLRDTSVESAGLKVSSSGAPGSIAATLVSLDQSSSFVVDAPLVGFDPNMHMGGNYPFRLDGNRQAVVYFKNIGTKPTAAVVVILYNAEAEDASAGGQFTPPLVTLGVGETIAIDLRQLRDSHTPDIKGRTLPVKLTRGQVLWLPHRMESPMGRLVAFDMTAGTTSNFSCTQCCDSIPSLSIVPNTAAGFVGTSDQLVMVESITSRCSGGDLGPYDVTQGGRYFPYNPAIANISSTARVDYVSFGSTSVRMDLTYEVPETEYDGFQWVTFAVLLTISPPVDVIRLRVTVPNTPVPLEASVPNAASIVAGESFTIRVEAVNSAGQVVRTNKGVSATSDRTLGSSETGLPSGGFNLVGGVYTLNNALLNRVMNQNRGTSYRFSTGTEYLDFFLYTYFRVLSTREGLVGGRTQCGYIIQPNDHFVALPVRGLCDTGVIVANPTTWNFDATVKKDAGPHFPGGLCDPSGTIEDPYWNTGTRPLVESLHCEAGDNNSGIDLADGTYAILGSPNQVVWRFGP